MNVFSSDKIKNQIKKTALDIAGNSKNDSREIIDKLWNFAKEEVKYKVTIVGKPEEILKLRYGSCIDKTILFVCFARSLGIKARYHVILFHLAPVIEIFINKAPKLMKELGINKSSIKILSMFGKIPSLPHLRPDVFVNKKWISIKKPSIDKELEDCFHGEILPSPRYQKDFGSFESIKDILETSHMQKVIKVALKHKRIASSFVNIINEFLYSLRHQENKVLSEDEDIEEIFQRVIDFSKKESSYY
ncbi:transglutaminase domain-containing protein [bacterium]|nr:transglutaminase domain-containing protein [bacterium]